MYRLSGLQTSRDP
jgi:hypothetical protein